MRLLVVEDERRLAISLAKGLRAEGFAVDVAFDGREGLYLAGEGLYDLAILDVNLWAPHTPCCWTSQVRSKT
jgi:DNA-binding response OmpR family regulator